MIATFTLANAFKEGDLLLGGTRDDRVREDARRALLGTRLVDIRRTVFVDDGVTAMLERGRDRSRDGDLDSLTVARVRELLLGPGGAAWASAHRGCLASEITAAVVKVMADDELGIVARKLVTRVERVAGSPSTGGIEIGDAGHFGSRIQPNSPGDDETEILFSILDGLAQGCGDVVIGLNPAADELDTIVRLEDLLERVVRRLELPTRYCVLSNIVKQHQAKQRTRVDVGFQSLAGTTATLEGMVGLDADGVLDLARGFDGLYFETGQGSSVTNGTAAGVDMVTLEARAYGVAREIQRRTGAWTIVNDVAGFIGPEVFRTSAQLERACLEDLVMARLHGLTMGLDVCATFHMGIPPDDLRAVTERVVDRGAPSYLMAVAGNADPMLGYLTTAFSDHPRLRRRTGRRMASAMRQRLDAFGSLGAAGLYALYAKAGGDSRSTPALEDEGRRTIATLRERGFELGASAADSTARLDAIYRSARHALYATVDAGVIRDACPRVIQVRTNATDREDYLAHPAAGEAIRAEDADALRRVHPVRRPQVQIVLSDGLNADAVNEQARALLPAVRQRLRESGCDAGGTDVVVRNGRVRAGYHVGAVVEPEVLVHVIGERPGTGLNSLSAYLTYGRDAAGGSRWQPQLDHSCTTAVCGIHPKGKPPEMAAAEIARTVARILEQKKSGVALE